MSMIRPWRCGSWRSQTPVTTARISATTVMPASSRTSRDDVAHVGALALVEERLAPGERGVEVDRRR